MKAAEKDSFEVPYDVLVVGVSLPCWPYPSSAQSTVVQSLHSLLHHDRVHGRMHLPGSTYREPMCCGEVFACPCNCSTCCAWQWAACHIQPRLDQHSCCLWRSPMWPSHCRCHWWLLEVGYVGLRLLRLAL